MTSLERMALLGDKDRLERQVHFLSGFLALVPRVRISPSENDIGIALLLRVTSSDLSFLSGSG